jgi:hypothetical protein
LSAHERNSYSGDEMLLNFDFIFKVLGITKRREYDEEHTNYSQSNVNKIKKLMLNTILKDCSVLMKKKVPSNNEIEEYLKSDDEKQFG